MILFRHLVEEIALAYSMNRQIVIFLRVQLMAVLVSGVNGRNVRQLVAEACKDEIGHAQIQSHYMVVKIAMVNEKFFLNAIHTNVP